MSEQAGLDFGHLVTRLVIAVALIAITIRLIPVLFQAIWNILPGVLILLLIIRVLHSMVKKTDGWVGFRLNLMDDMLRLFGTHTPDRVRAAVAG